MNQKRKPSQSTPTKSSFQKIPELERIYRTAPVGLGLYDRELRFVWLNDFLATINGRSKEAHIGRTVREVVPLIAVQIESPCRTVFKVGKAVLNVETHGSTSADPGAERFWLASYLPVEDEHGNVNHVSVVVQEITKRRSAEKALEERQAQYSAIFASAKDAFLIFDMDGNIVEANPEACAMYGYPYEELVTLSGKDIVHPDYGSIFDRFRKDVQKTGRFEAESQDVKKDGTPFVVEVKGAQFEFRGKKHVLAILRDITERKRSEQDLKKSFAEIKELKERLQQENIYLREEIQLRHKHEEIIGESDPLKSVLNQVEQVAKTESTVLLLGETGTGKELFAREIHALSSRRNCPVVKVNCAALPAMLVESELFGREKGAYTGAISKQAGRFEVANGTTIFLDEISELPLELQAKLLRVLQEGQFERVGSTRTISVDVRVIAATNQDLAKAVKEGRFREDLYYRLNVFPIVIPPLRDRQGDIPLLVWSCVKEFEKTMGKKIESISRKSMDALQRYTWPGNVRELKNVVERAMILCKDSTLRISLPQQNPSAMDHSLTLIDVEKRHILAALERTSWRVSGESGAAKLLGLKPTTLEYRMKKLGITRG